MRTNSFRLFISYRFLYGKWTDFFMQSSWLMCIIELSIIMSSLVIRINSNKMTLIKNTFFFFTCNFDCVIRVLKNSTKQYNFVWAGVKMYVEECRWNISGIFRRKNQIIGNLSHKSWNDSSICFKFLQVVDNMIFPYKCLWIFIWIHLPLLAYQNAAFFLA